MVQQQLWYHFLGPNWNVLIHLQIYSFRAGTCSTQIVDYCFSGGIHVGIIKTTVLYIL